MGSYNKLKRTSTIQELIDAGKRLHYSPDKMHVKDTFINKDGELVIFNIYSLMDRFMDLLDPFIQEVELTDNEYLKYRFQPKRLCVDVYNTIDMAPIILKINNMVSLLEFDQQTIRLFKPSVMSILNEIVVLEKDRYNSNEAEIFKRIDETE
jgi:hypothetical protein